MGAVNRLSKQNSGQNDTIIPTLTHTGPVAVPPFLFGTQLEIAQ